MNDNIEKWIASVRAAPPELTGQDELQSLFAAMRAENFDIPPDLEERAIRLIVAEQPDNQDALQRLFQLLNMQGKQIPPELEEQALRLIVRDRPDDQDVLQRLFQLLQTRARKSRPISRNGRYA